MTFVKIQKNNVYSKRFQVHFRRRRLGKTDYYQRKRLTLQRKNKYNTAKWRFVVRRTNQRIICQVVWSTLDGDKVKAQADSFELKKWGVTAGLTNFSAAYATGLLCSRRLLKTLDKENKTEDYTPDYFNMFDIIKEADGTDVDFEQLCNQKDIGYRPFTCFLDLGLVRATKGNRVFAAMKGAIDGGVNIPHDPKIFPQKKAEKKPVKAAPPSKKGKKEDKKEEEKKKKKVEEEDEGEFDGTLLRERIFGHHVQAWMEAYDKKKDKQDYQFSQWKKCLKDAKVKTVEELYKKVHAEIRKNPERPEKKKQEYKYTRDAKDINLVTGPNGNQFRRDFRLKNEQRKERVNEKIAKFFEARKK
jgi:large subunit ribosomal protein L5e